MGLLGDEMARSVVRLMLDTGQTATFRRETAGAYNSSNGTVGAVTTDDESVIASMVQRKDSFSKLLDQVVGSSSVERGSRRVLMSARRADGTTSLTKVPRAGDLIVGIGDTVKVIEAHVIRVNDAAVAYALGVQD